MMVISIFATAYCLPKRTLTTLREEKDFKIIDETHSCSKVKTYLRSQKVDIILTKVEDQSDLRKIQNLIKERNCKYIVAVGNADSEIIFECIKLGVRGLIRPGISRYLLKKAIRVIYKGEEVWFGRKFFLKVRSELARLTTAPAQSDRIKCLSNREKEVLHLVARGYKNRDIAEHLYISENTVKSHLCNIYVKLGVEGRINAALFNVTVKLNELNLKIQVLEKKTNTFYFIINTIKNLSITYSNSETLYSMIKVICKTINIKQFCLMLWDEDQQVLKNAIIDCSNHKDEKVIKDINLSIGKGISGKIFQTGEQLLVKNKNMRNKFELHEGCCCMLNTPFLSIPLRCNKLLGVFNIHKSQKANFTKEDIEMFSLVVDHIAIAINRLRVYTQLKQK